MATPLEALQSKKKLLESSLGSSSTAYQPNSSLPKDVSLDTQLASVNEQIDSLRSSGVRASWYGPSDSDNESTGGGDGVLMGTLKALQKPLNAIAGTAQYALGKGVKQDLMSNINEATKTGLTFGNILQQSGTPRGVQVPLGFALDVMFDPVNWLTAGTSALIPRAATGLIKGGAKSGVKGAIEGLTTGVSSNLAKKGSTVMNLMPFVNKIADLAPVIEDAGTKTGFLTKGAIKYRDLAEKLSKKAVSGAENFDLATGTTMADRLNKTPFGWQGGTIGNALEDIVRGKKEIPGLGFLSKEVAPGTTRGDKIADFFKYSPQKASEIADLQDKVIKLGREKGVILVRTETGSDFVKIGDFFDSKASIKLPDKIGETIDVAIRDADGVLKSDYAGKVKIYDDLDNAKALLEAAGEDYNLKNLTEAYKLTEKGKTGVAWYDKVIDKLKSTTIDDISKGRLGSGDLTDAIKTEADDLVKTWNSYNSIKDLKPLNKLLTGLEDYKTIFKLAKVPMNVGSHVVAWIGNFFMGGMMGLPMWKPQYVKAMADANSLVKGKLGAAGFKEMFYSDIDSLISMADNNPTRFKQLTGLDPSEIASKLTTEQKISNVLNENTTRNEVLNILKKATDQALEAEATVGNLSKMEDVVSNVADFEKSSNVNKSIVKEKLGSYPSPSEQLAKMLKESPSIRRGEEFGSFTAGEISQNDMLQKVKDFVAKQAETSPSYKIANTLLNSMPKWYEQIDQTFKLGTSNFITKVGLSEQELKIISRTIPIDIAKDVLKDENTGKLLFNVVNGEKLYRLNQLKAAEIATEAFMNYAAMPDFVRLMRGLHFASAPFVSFPYAMAIKTGKTLINNPAVFNKIGFMINEMNASRTPQEKAALKDKYNQYMNSPTVVKMFGMWNTNVKNFVPYFQLNMLNPSERNYGNSTQSQIMKMIDKVPIMQDPISAVIKDYFIQPWVLSGSGEVPQGTFGQPLFPSFDENGKPLKVGLGKKALYGAQAIAEGVVPGSLSYAGLLNMPLNISPDIINKVPSYGFRNLAHSTQGRSSIGANTKEDEMRKTIRSLFGRSGIPAYILDPTKTSPK